MRSNRAKNVSDQRKYNACAIFPKLLKMKIERLA